MGEFQGRGKLLEFSKLRHAGLYCKLKGKAVDTVVHCSNFPPNPRNSFLHLLGGLDAKDSQLSPFSGIVLVQREMYLLQ